MNDSIHGAYPDPAVSIDELRKLCDEQLPLTRHFGFLIEQLEPGATTVRAPFKADFTRPGGTVAGPVLMAMADLALYAVVLSLLGPVAMAVTTSLNVNFLRRPEPADVIAHGTILKLGKRLAIGEVSLYSDVGEDEVLVAHVTGTYSIPPGTTGSATGLPA